MGGGVASRRRTSADDVRYALARGLTERDRAILRVLHRHGVFRVDQLAAIFFDSPARARVRLLALYRRELLDRFQPYRPGGGSSPYHYVLGRAGVGVMAAEAGEDPVVAMRRWTTSRTLALARTQRREHIVGVNGFYAALVAEDQRGGGRLVAWRTEAEATRWAGGDSTWRAAFVRPDGWGTWAEGGAAVEFFLEYDRGTEALGRLVAKLGDYARFEAERSASAWVAFAFVSAGREQAARAALGTPGVPVATATLTPGASPAGAIWLPTGSRGPRLRLVELAAVPKPAEALERADGSKAWRYEGRLEEAEGAPTW